jgi:hypothetical protein
MRKKQFRAELLDGHKGPAVLVPFDPATTWGTRPTRVASKIYGIRPGHLVRGTMNGCRFEGWIGSRWGKFFILVDEELQQKTGAAVGDMVRVAIEPRPAAPTTGRKKTKP